MPDWFKEGLVSYVGEEWSTELDNQLRDIFARREYKDFTDLIQRYPKLIGHSIWYYINQNYGKATVSNLLYLTRINRSIESGFLYVLGNSYEKTLENWQAFFEKRYTEEVKTMQPLADKNLIPIKNKYNVPITQMKLSPSGQYVAYVQNEVGKYKIYIQDLISGDRKLVKKGGFRNMFQATDYDYPLLAWSPSNFELAIMHERRDVLYLSKYDINTKETITEEMDPQYQRVYSMDYVNVVDMVLSATVGGFSDIFYYRTNVRGTSRITHDFYDDLDAVFVQTRNRKGILFASNRASVEVANLKLDTILPVNTFDIYYYDLETKSKELIQITNTPFADERSPMGIDSTYFSFLSDETGIYNRKYGYLEDYIAYYEKVIQLKKGEEIVLHQDSTLENLDSTLIDTTFLRPVIKTRAINHTASNLNRNILSQDKAAKSDRIVEMVYNNGQYQAFLKTANPAENVTPTLTKFQSRKVFLSKKKETTLPSTIPPQNELPIRITNSEEPLKEKKEPQKEQESGEYSFESAFEQPKEEPKQKEEKEYLFQSEFDETPEEKNEAIAPPQRATDRKTETPPESITPPIENVTVESITAESSNQKAVTKFRPARIVSYRLKFRTAYVTTSLDNSLLYGGLESPAANPDGFQTPVPGILIKTNFKDLFEDYEFELGARFPTTFNGDEYFLTFKSKKKRLDWTYTAYRKTRRYTPSDSSFPPEKNQRSSTLRASASELPFGYFQECQSHCKS